MNTVARYSADLVLLIDLRLAVLSKCAALFAVGMMTAWARALTGLR